MKKFVVLSLVLCAVSFVLGIALSALVIGDRNMVVNAFIVCNAAAWVYLLRKVCAISPEAFPARIGVVVISLGLLVLGFGLSLGGVV